MSFSLKRILLAGTHDAGSRSKTRSIQLTNTIALISAFLFFILITYLAINNGVTTVVQIGSLTVFTLCSVILLNHFRLYNLSRSVMSVIVPLSVVAAIFVSRLNLIGQYKYSQIASVYCILITTSVIPLLIFSLQEKRSLYSSLVFNALILIFFDFAFYRFSSAHAQEHYTFIRFLGGNLVILIMFLILSGSIAFFKDLFEHFEEKNNQLINRLNEKNRELHLSNLELFELNQNIKVQNEEIKSQSEELLLSQENIIEANLEIERQKKELEKKNNLLEASLGEKSIDLFQTNQQLVKQNSELQQFSFTVSHNLRAPVASLKGLIYLHHMSKTDEERAHIIKLFEESTSSLDTIIEDLGKIIDIRHENFASLEKVSLQAEVDLVLQSLNTFIISNEVSISTDFAWPQLVSIKAYVNSILFNLINNAIKYRSPDRKLTVRVSSRLIEDNVVLEVADNGLGIDLNRHHADLFKLYKRFHSHTPGKGLGLYIVKQQLEKLNAQIEVDSVLGKGTVFRIFHQKNPLPRD